MHDFEKIREHWKVDEKKEGTALKKILEICNRFA